MIVGQTFVDILHGDVIDELKDSTLSMDSWEAKVQEVLADKALNNCEICRATNGIDPGDFVGCFPPFSYETKPDRCMGRPRGCGTHSGAVDKRLRRMEARGLVKSLSIRWFDHRDPGQAGGGSIQLDNFRLYYTTRASLARRLVQDVEMNLGPVDYD